jgi:hypothetical protein
VSVDIEKTNEKLVEVYRYGEAFTSRHLIGAVMNIKIPKEMGLQTSLEFLWRTVQGDSDWVSEADPYSLLALDVRRLDPAAMKLLSLCFAEAGLGEDARDELFVRHERGLDPAMKSGQGRLFTPNQGGLSDVALAREEGRWEELAALP